MSPSPTWTPTFPAAAEPRTGSPTGSTPTRPHLDPHFPGGCEPQPQPDLSTDPHLDSPSPRTPTWIPPIDAIPTPRSSPSRCLRAPGPPGMPRPPCRCAPFVPAGPRCRGTSVPRGRKENDTAALFPRPVPVPRPAPRGRPGPCPVPAHVAGAERWHCRAGAGRGGDGEAGGAAGRGVPVPGVAGVLPGGHRPPAAGGERYRAGHRRQGSGWPWGPRRPTGREGELAVSSRESRTRQGWGGPAPVFNWPVTFCGSQPRQMRRKSTATGRRYPST